MLTVVPDLIQPLVAYRMWGYRIDQRGLHLGAVNGDDGSWAGAGGRTWVVASCEWVLVADAYSRPKLRHRAPKEFCTCGFYAVKTIPDAATMIAMVRLARRSAYGSADAPEEVRSFGSVFGRVELAGKVIEHRHGYRAQQARVLELIPLRPDDGVTGSVASRLQVPTADPLDLPRDDEVDDELEEMRRGPAVGGRDRPPTPVERMRLRAHRRYFRVIPGGRSAPTSP